LFALEYSKQTMVKLPTPLPDEAYAAINDVYFLRSIGVAAGELITLPMGGLPGAAIAWLSAPVTLPIAGLASLGFYVIGRKRPIVTPSFLAGTTSKETAYSAMGAIGGNLASQFIPIPMAGAYAEPALTAGGMLLVKNMA